VSVTPPCAGFLALSLSDQREIETRLNEASVALGRHQVQIIMVCDLEGLQWTRAMRAISHFQKLSKVLDENVRCHSSVRPRRLADASRTRDAHQPIPATRAPCMSMSTFEPQGRLC
jgi:hypothetical protein